ncbi:MAG: PhoH family protein [Gammaproteobacteria bacterium]|nr:PhoH family protein [Gammaproteobacteria bacterium]
MSRQLQPNHFILEPTDNERLANLCGQFDGHLRQIEQRLGVEINSRGNMFNVIGDLSSVTAAGEVLKELYAETEREQLTAERVHLFLQEAGLDVTLDKLQNEAQLYDVAITTKRGNVRGRGYSQQRYLQNILSHDINFGVGPAGTGKTYLAVACAVEALEKEKIRRLILARPAVEAGERLGFLPGDLAQKVDPYLRPLYDALYEMLGFERVAKLVERDVIEIAPLAYMRGRTLNESFIILDEAQNTTVEQMKMFLTRIGFGSTVVITGDVTQVDLSRGVRSGLRHVVDVLKGVEGISFTFFNAKDVVRHPLVQKIVTAYESHESQQQPIKAIEQVVQPEKGNLGD